MRVQWRAGFRFCSISNALCPSPVMSSDVRRHRPMLPTLITLLVAAPILALGTWLYLRRRTLSPRTRIALMVVFFLFVLISGPAIFLMWHYEGTSREILSTGRGGRQVLGYLPLLWLSAVLGIGTQLFRL